VSSCFFYKSEPHLLLDLCKAISGQDSVCFVLKFVVKSPPSPSRQPLAVIV
jgi:hypothetical protein